jgi:hypothetical protein
MSVTREQALAFVAGALDSKRLIAQLEGQFGLGLVPSVEDFSSTAEKAIDRSGELLDHMREVLECLEACQATREKQLELPLEPPAAKPLEKASKR